MRRHLRASTIATSVFLALTACNVQPPQPDAEGMLVPGGSYLDDGGVVLSALPGAIDSEVGVSVEAVQEPAITLPGDAKALAEFQRISASRDVYAADDPFVIGLPVPAEADPGALALAVLLEPGDMTDVGEPSGSHWQLLEGVYDPNEGYFVTTVALLTQSGRTFVLVQAPGWSSPVAGSASAPSAGLAPQQVGGDFQVRCRGFQSDDNDLGITCSQSDEGDLETVLADAFADYRGVGFAPPHLKKTIDPSAALLWPYNSGLGFLEYVAELRPFRSVDEDDDIWLCGVRPSGAMNLGGYSPATRKFYVCIDNAGVTARGAEVAHHEYFHATQYGYPAVRRSHADWVIEATATASERSLATMLRDPSRELRVVDVPLTLAGPDFIEYTTQDLFVYAGRVLGRGLEYLIDVFEEGASNGGLDAAFEDLGFTGGLPTLYWSWAKNQAFEAEFDLGAAELGSTCALTTGVAGLITVNYQHVVPPADRTVTLPPLTSAVIQLDFAALPDAAYTTRVDVDELGVSDPSEIKVKFYDAADAGTTNCWAEPDSKQAQVTVSAGQPRTLYALISNLQMDASGGASLSFGQSEPALEILSPASGSVFTEDDDVEFLAVGTGLGDQDPGTTLVTWTYERHDGVPFTFSSDNGEAVTHRFCDGTYTVVAELISATTQEAAGDSVTFTVSNSNPPPPECAPSIDILAPNEDDTFPLGQSVSFEAVIDDDHPETDEPLHPIIWRDGGPSGLIIAQNTLAFSTSKFSEGVHEIYVEYGTADDAVTIEILDTSNTEPTATIASPADGAQFRWDEIGDPAQIQFTGSGTDAEDGTLTGSSLTWSYLPEGSAMWQNGGNGTSFTLFVVFDSDNFTTYKVRLRATDSEGLFDVHEIEIAVQNPPI